MKAIENIRKRLEYTKINFDRTVRWHFIQSELKKAKID